MCNTWEKQLVMYIGSAIGIGFFLNNEYRISENGKIDIGTPLPTYIYVNHVCACDYAQATVSLHGSMVFYKHIVYYRPTEN